MSYKPIHIGHGGYAYNMEGILVTCLANGEHRIHWPKEAVKNLVEFAIKEGLYVPSYNDKREGGKTNDLIPTPTQMERSLLAGVSTAGSGAASASDHGLTFMGYELLGKVSVDTERVSGEGAEESRGGSFEDHYPR